MMEDVNPAEWREHLYNLSPERWASLRGKSFWVTGAGTGYGRAIACGLAAAGCRVFLTGRRREKLLETLEEISSFQIPTDDCRIVQADIARPEEIARGCEEVKGLGGSLHGLVNNAAIPSRPGSLHPLQEDSLEGWNRAIATNLTAPWFITRMIFPHMLASGQARVLFMTSGAGWASTPGFGIYNVSKAALNSLCASMAQEYGRRFPGEDIQINGLNPGEARTEMNQGSNQSPYAVVSMVLLLLSHPPGGPNGKFFHRGGRSLQFGDSESYSPPLIDPHPRTDRRSDAGDAYFAKSSRVKAPKESRLDPSSPQTMGLGENLPVLVKEGYKGFNIILYNSEMHAIAQETGPIDLPQVRLGQFYEFRRRGQWIVAGSAQEVVEKIERAVILRETSGRSNPSRYPIEIPPVDFLPQQDFVLLELPPRYIPLMPNGLGYVHNILKRTGISFQTLDANVIFYHRYHAQRFLNGGKGAVLPSGNPMPADPWQITDVDKWNEPEVLEYFQPQIQEVIDGLVEAKPKIVGLSLNGLNLKVAQEVVKGVRRGLPEAIVLVGGHSCVYPVVGPRHFPDFDYMFIGEAELTLAPLVKSLLAGQRPKDVPGILSRYDSPGRGWEPAPLLEDLDATDFPTYEWAKIGIYRTCDGNHLIPITASRGCRWSRCNFCAERFPWRRRSPENVVNEMEWFANRGGRGFHFNESDLNGDPDALLAICDEIVKRKLKIALIGQLRIDRRSDRDFFVRLRAAGFASLRFGVDGWSKNTLHLQRKGYTMSLVEQNLRDCYEAGIQVGVNIVVGIPGETDEDIEESIQNMLRNKNHFHILENIHTLILAHGSEYYEHPEQHGIFFRGDKKELYERYPHAIPPDLWFSMNPYIDQEVRVKRMKAIANALHSNGVRMGGYAESMVIKMEKELGSQRISQGCGGEREKEREQNANL
jgi:NAD(P)-dependent dehydrogenase (short-subunit alcohol dehydrogenase family)